MTDRQPNLRFHKGELWMRRHDDIRPMLRAVATRRKITPYILADMAGRSNAIGDYSRAESTAKSTSMRQLLEVVTFHRYDLVLVDPSFAGQHVVNDLGALREGLRACHHARELSADAFRRAAKNSSSMTTFINGVSESKGLNVQSNALFRLLEHYGLPLVVRDLLDRSVSADPLAPN